MTRSSAAWPLGRSRWTISLLGWKSRSGRFGCLSLQVLLWHWDSRWVRGLPTNGNWHQRHVGPWNHNKALAAQSYLRRQFRGGMQNTIESRLDQHGTRSSLGEMSGAAPSLLHLYGLRTSANLLVPVCRAVKINELWYF